MTKKMKGPTLSLCMIVKNEEKFLGQCLESVKDIVDEMIIVDTGSEDRTVEIAESYGAKVYHHPWQGSFSEARNHALQYATCDWILQMDADEQLEVQDIPIIKEVVKGTQYNAIYVALLNDSPEGWTKHYFQRIYRRGKAHYEGIVHNQLIYEGADLRTEIRVYHWGYNLSEAEMQAKFKRSGELLLKQLEDDGTDPFAHQNYLRVLRASFRFEEGVGHGLHALKVCKDRMTEIHYQMIAYDTAYCMLNSNQVNKCIELCLEVLRKHPNNIDILYIYACARLKIKEYEEAVDAYKKVQTLQLQEKKSPKHTQLIVDTINFDHRVWGNLSECYFHLGETTEAEESIKNAIAIKPKMYVYKMSYAWFLAEMGRMTEAMSMIDHSEHNDDLDHIFYQKLATLFAKFPVMGNVIQAFERGVEKFPHSDEMHNSYGYALLDKDRQKAEYEFLKAISLNHDHVGAHFGLAKLYMQNKDIEKLESQVNYFLEHVDNHPLLKELGQYCLNIQQFQWAISILSKYIEYEPENSILLSDIATAYAKLGQFEAAFIGYQQALKINPNDPNLLKNIEILQKLKNFNKT